MTYVVLLRGVNLVGRNRLAMKDLKAVLENDGCAEVRTYVQSGNAVFRSRISDAARVRRRVASAISRGCGVEPRVFVLTQRDLERAVAGNPFPEAEADPKTVHLFFLAGTPKPGVLKTLQALAANGEQCALDGRVFYLFTPAGFGTSKLAQRAERLLGVDATARNWRTVTTLLRMAGPAQV